MELQRKIVSEQVLINNNTSSVVIEVNGDHIALRKGKKIQLANGDRVFFPKLLLDIFENKGNHAAITN